LRGRRASVIGSGKPPRGATLAFALAACAGLPLALVACTASSRAAAAAQCQARVIVGLAPGSAVTPGILASIGKSAAVTLTFLSTSGAGLFAAGITAAGADASCDKAIARLRRDARVRLVELDSRVQAHGAAAAP
jgi:hypothetical protein